VEWVSIGQHEEQRYRQKKGMKRLLPIAVGELGRGYMYQGVFVGGFLPLLGHGTGLLASEGVDGVEESDGGGSELDNLEEDAETLTLGGGSAGTVSTEGNVVSWMRGSGNVSEK
jgi:hypothetical protein